MRGPESPFRYLAPRKGAPLYIASSCQKRRDTCHILFVKPQEAVGGHCVGMAVGCLKAASRRQRGVVFDDQIAELMEIDENLARAELSPAQEAAHVARRKVVWGKINTGQNLASIERGPGQEIWGEISKTAETNCSTSLSDGRGAGPPRNQTSHGGKYGPQQPSTPLPLPPPPNRCARLFLCARRPTYSHWPAAGRGAGGRTLSN